MGNKAQEGGVCAKKGQTFTRLIKEVTGGRAHGGADRR